MRKDYQRLSGALVLALSALACDGSPSSLPPIPERQKPDLGFDVARRAECSAAVASAADHGDVGTIIRLAAERADFNCAVSGMPALDVAIRSGAAARVEALLNAGADPNGRWGTHGDRLPLQDTLESRLFGFTLKHPIEIVRVLLDDGADPNARWCPFESRGPQPEACHSWDGFTPLFAAALLDDVECVQALLDSGADSNLEDSNRSTAVEYARSPPVVDLLLPQVRVKRGTAADELRHAREEDAVRQFARRHSDPDHQRGSPATPLCRAVAGGFEERISLLLRNGADPNRRCDSRYPSGWTPLASALISMRSGAISSTLAERILQTLVSHGADANLRWCPTDDVKTDHVNNDDVRPAKVSTAEVETADERCDSTSGTTPLMAAAEDVSIVAVKLLLASGADPTLRDWKHQTAADYARRSRRSESEAVRGLLAR